MILGKVSEGDKGNDRWARMGKKSTTRTKDLTFLSTSLVDFTFLFWKEKIPSRVWRLVISVLHREEPNGYNCARGQAVVLRFKFYYLIDFPLYLPH